MLFVSSRSLDNGSVMFVLPGLNTALYLYDCKRKTQRSILAQGFDLGLNIASNDL